MGCQHNYGTDGATGGGFSAMLGLQPYIEDRQDRGNPNWDYQRRAPRTWKDRNRWFSLWSYGCRISGGSVVGDAYSPVGQDLTSKDLFEPYSCDGDGCQSLRFIRGTCLDSAAAPIANALVQAFIAGTDVWVGEDYSRDDGTYGVGVDTPAGTLHYLRAFKAGSPNVGGTTVETLTTTNVDGT